jgi:hypothetical protein
VLGNYRKSAVKTDSHEANKVLGTITSDEEPRTEFALDVYGDGKSYRNFFPDPELDFQIIPASSDDPPNNLVVTNGNVVVESIQDSGSLPSGPGKYSRNSRIDFQLREVQPGDVLDITYQPIQGTGDITLGPIDYPGDLTGKKLVFSLENGPDKTVTFSNQVSGPEKLVAEINAQLGSTIAYVEDTSTAKYLRLESDFSIILRSSNATKLGLTPGNNDAVAKNDTGYVITDVGVISGTISYRWQIRLLTAPTVTAASQHFKIRRPGVQRISSTDMANNKEGALYYFDVELVSDGVGNEFNIQSDLQLECLQYKSDGYHLYNEDENLSFSTAELLHMIIGRRMLPIGSTDAPMNMRQLSLTNIQINYEKVPLVSEIQNFAKSELDRVLTANILVRHLQPHFVQMEVNYTGGSKSDVVTSDIEDLINGLLPDEALEVSAVGEIPRRRGASSVDMPITLIAVVHYKDRKIRIVRSKNYITAGRLATFIPDVLTITKEGGV